MKRFSLTILDGYKASMLFAWKASKKICNHFLRIKQYIPKVCDLRARKQKKSTKNINSFVYFNFLLYLCRRLAAANCFAHANHTYFYWRVNQREYKVWQLFILRNKIGKRQCILRYVLLLLYYSWVMPDTHSLIKHKQYFFLYLLVIKYDLWRIGLP